MGREIVVEEARSLADALEELTRAGCQIAMVDGQLVMPGAPPAPGWREVRLRGAAGMVTVTRRGGGVAVTVFGNAAPELQAMQELIAEILRGA